MASMKAVMKKEAKPGFEIGDVEIPPVRDNDVLVKVKATSICGTDVHIWKWDAWAQKRIKPPIIVGHEFAGEVLEVGKNVASLGKGDLVSGETHIDCGHCFQCRTGNAHICENVKLRGIDVDGCFAEYHVMPEDTAWKNDPNMPVEVASAQEPLGNAVHAVFAESVAGKTVAVMGCGPIGMCAVALSKAAGAEKVFAVDVNDYRLKLAEKLCGGGVEFVPINSSKVDPVGAIRGQTREKGGADVVVEMSGNPDALKQCFSVVRHGGRVSILGVFPKEVALDITDGIVFKGARVYGINGRLMFDTWYKSASFLRSGKVDLQKIITHKFNGLDKMNEAMQVMASGESGKVVILP